MPTIRRSAYILTVVAVAAFVVSVVWKPAPPPPAFAGLRSSDVPEKIGAWRSDGDYAIAQDVRDALASADIVSRTYSRSGGDSEPPIDFVLIGGTDRSALHDPRSCLVGAGWRLENDHVETLPQTGIAARTCQAVGQPDSPGYDIEYLYVVDGEVRTTVTQIRAEMLVSALLGRQNRPVYFLRVLVPLFPDAAARAADHRRLVDFADAAWEALGPRISKGG